MNQTSPEIAALLAQLHEITAPAPITWWPPAIGWWFVLGITLALTGLFFYLIKRFRRQQRWNRAISAELATVAQNNDPATVVNSANKLLKRLVRLKFPEVQANGLHGNQWVNFLEQKYGEVSKEINLAPLADAGYQSAPDFDIPTLLNDLRTWIKICC